MIWRIGLASVSSSWYVTWRLALRRGGVSKDRGNVPGAGRFRVRGARIHRRSKPCVSNRQPVDTIDVVSFRSHSSALSLARREIKYFLLSAELGE